MAKLSLTELASLQDESAALGALNANFDAIVTAMENTFSRDGTLPNELDSTLDANNQRIINLPTPVSDADAARHGDLQTYVDDASDEADAAASSATSAASSATASAVSAASSATSATAASNSATAASDSADEAAASAATVAGQVADLQDFIDLDHTAAGLTVLEIADPGADRLVGWDDTASSMKALALADMNEEAAPGAGDFGVFYTAEGALVKVDVTNFPAGGLNNVVEDTTPQLGGDLDLNSSDITGTGNIDITGTIDASGRIKGAFSGARVTKAADQTAADYTTATVIAWDAEVFDTDGYHDNVTNNSRLTVPSAGYYEVTAIIRVDSFGADLWSSIQLNHKNSAGATQAPMFMAMEIGQGIGKMCLTTGPILCATGDFFDVALQVETDNSVTLDDAFNFFSIKYLGE